MVQVLDPVIHPVRRVVLRWAERSQRDACRNAMVASTVLAERRRERLEVADYLAHALGTAPSPQARRAGAAVSSLPAARLG
jgi:hypothetical protein